MTNNEFEATDEESKSCFTEYLNSSRFCRYCGAKLMEGEVDVCDGCFDSEQLRM